MNVYLIMELNEGRMTPLGIADSYDNAVRFATYHVNAVENRPYGWGLEFEEVDASLDSGQTWLSKRHHRVRTMMAWAADIRHIAIHELELNRAYPGFVGSPESVDAITKGMRRPVSK